ncbi:hypothetical protein LTR78_001502 [Recurvomyces mirabilis]|uniref:Uncharacterized protein n=1 Tax=Recurvomyces mirabilis TaxID=574656 RepID=A0AAE1C5P1_9PEZI|nr:hypothetical protein LTR78_001502 [Recurvomyces mirabilis]KAK5161481.1 hypothetical protein LTS14_001277 [Recurvomyces mirabilis]
MPSHINPRPTAPTFAERSDHVNCAEHLCRSLTLSCNLSENAEPATVTLNPFGRTPFGLNSMYGQRPPNAAEYEEFLRWKALQQAPDPASGGQQSTLPPSFMPQPQALAPAVANTLPPAMRVAQHSVIDARTGVPYFNITKTSSASSSLSGTAKYEVVRAGEITPMATIKGDTLRLGIGDKLEVNGRAIKIKTDHGITSSSPTFESATGVKWYWIWTKEGLVLTDKLGGKAKPEHTIARVQGDVLVFEGSTGVSFVPQVIDEIVVTCLNMIIVGTKRKESDKAGLEALGEVIGTVAS